MTQEMSQSNVKIIAKLIHKPLTLNHQLGTSQMA